MSIPVFAVVGHPNKGKSSIVATLAQDDSVQISLIPGTTVKCRHFPMKVDGEVQYILVDTPGFQRARQVLAWMKARAATAAERTMVVYQFVEVHRNTGKFIDECELLEPLIKGAGILYVIDGSRPYGEEYEAEMEILRWTGQPSIALINMIGHDNYIEEWRAALGQYFKIVRVFNAVTAEFHKRLELLKAFGQLREEWQAPLSRAVKTLEEDRRVRRQRSALRIAEMLASMIALTMTKRLPSKEESRAYETSLAQRYKATLRSLEQKGRRTIEDIYDYHELKCREGKIEILDEDLFSLDSWNIFGLKRRQVLATGAASGALLGSGVDLAVGGTSLLLGAAIGSMVGGASAWFYYDRISDIKMLGLPLGGTELRIGPAGNINFPYVVLGRALYHHAAVTRRTHAQRDILSLDNAAETASASSIPEHQRRKLEKVFAKLRNSDNGSFDPALVESLAEIIETIMEDSDRMA
jgi:GTPase Era involved in 16S rRNA processing